ncbi:hypothetical protein HDV63DRAFT_381581 [Trichoderma sp. SZMC 28014]
MSRTDPINPTTPLQSRSTAVTNTKFGNHAILHQGDQIIGQSNVHVTYNYGNWVSQNASFDYNGDQSSGACWSVPFGRNKDFIGRDLVLDQLLEIIPPDADKDDCQKIAIEGLGGVGKTQIALEAAFRIRDKYKDCHVFWVPAIDISTFENAYREIGRALKIRGIDDTQADVKQLVRAALSRCNNNWLLIIDNADDVGLFFNTSKPALSDFLPFSLMGSILLTTRNDEVSQKLDIRRESIIHLSEMSRSEAVKMLQKGLPAHQIKDTQSMLNLLDFLADLPLAIKQASAYMVKTGIGVAKYVEYCSSSDDRLIELLSKGFEDRARYKSADARNPVATTWLISFDHVARNKPLAAKYLQHMSLLAEKNISKHLLPLDDELEAYEAIGVLKAYAFISERADEGSYDIHRLVRLVMRNWLVKEGELMLCATSVMQRLSIAYPRPDYANKDTWTKLLPHALVALKYQEHSSDTKARMKVMRNVSWSNFFLGRYKDAEQIWRQTVDLYTTALGVEHRDTLACRSGLASVLSGQGQYEEAKQIQQRTLELLIKVLGDEHPHTLRGKTDLATLLSNQGQYKEAQKIYQQAFELKAKVLGAEHPSTLFSMVCLATTSYGQCRYEEAERRFQKALELRIKVLGPEHHDTLFTMNCLAQTFGLQGRYKEAEQIFQQTLESQTKVLGIEHPDTFRSIYNLGCAFNAQDRYKEAEQLFQQTLELRVKVLGLEHPDTLECSERLESFKKKQVLRSRRS